MFFLLDHLIPSIAVCENLDKCLQDYFVEEKNAKNSHSNGYSRSAVITKSESRGENVEQQNIQERAQHNDENGNTERKSSTGDHDDQDAPEKRDLLQTITDRSAQASPSNVCIEENKQTRDYSGNDDETLEQNVGVTDRSRESTESQDVSITETDASQDQTVKKPANNCNDVETIANEDSLMAHEHVTTNDENQEIKMEHNPTGLEPVQDTTNNVNSDRNDTEPIKIADDLNAEQTLSSHSRGSAGENGQQQQDSIELSKNIDNGSDQTRPVDVSTDQDLESLKRVKEDTELDQSNVNQQVTSGNEKIDQL